MTGPRLSIIPARAATDPALKPRDLQVLCVLGRHTDDLGWCRKSQVKMADEMGCARSTVFEAIERLVKAGYLERHVQEEQSGRDSPHVYRVILDPVHPRVADVPDADDPCRQVGTPAGISAPPAGPGSAPPAGSGPAPKNDPFRTTPSERMEREARAGEQEEGEVDEVAAAERPGTAAFEKRVIRFCSGRGFGAGPWKDWDAGGALQWITRQFGQLTVEERAEAERWRDAYLLDVTARKKGPQPVGVWLRDKVWRGLDPSILERAEQQKQGRLKPEDRPQPDGWAKCLGPTGMAFLFGKLMDGPADGELAARQFLPDAMLRKAWPAPWWWQAKLREKGGAIFDPGWHGLAGGMEPVPQGTAVLAEWKAEFARRGWPWFATFDNTPVVYCPVGGPDGLRAFEDAMRRMGDGSAEGTRAAAE